MRTYCGYTEEEIREMEDEGCCPRAVLSAYLNDDYDGSDDWDFD